MARMRNKFFTAIFPKIKRKDRRKIRAGFTNLISGKKFLGDERVVYYLKKKRKVFLEINTFTMFYGTGLCHNYGISCRETTS